MLPLTTKELIDTLYDYQHRVARGEAPDNFYGSMLRRFSEFESDTDLADSAKQWLQNMIGLFGADGAAGVMAFYDFRDEVIEHQKRHNISSLIRENVCINTPVAERCFSYWWYHDQLDLLPQDRLILANERWIVAGFFQQVTGELDRPLHIEKYDSCDNSYLEPATAEDLHSSVAIASMAYLSQSSIDWQPRPDGSRVGYSAKRNPPDRIELIVCIGDAGRQDCDRRVFVGAVNPDD